MEQLKERTTDLHHTQVMKTTNTEKQTLCALCKQPVEITGFCLLAPDGEKHFCCEGCLCVYQLLNESNSPPSKPKNNN